MICSSDDGFTNILTLSKYESTKLHAITLRSNNEKQKLFFFIDSSSESRIILKIYEKEIVEIVSYELTKNSKCPYLSIILRTHWYRNLRLHLSWIHTSKFSRLNSYFRISKLKFRVCFDFKVGFHFSVFSSASGLAQLTKSQLESARTLSLEFVKVIFLSLRVVQETVKIW